MPRFLSASGAGKAAELDGDVRALLAGAQAIVPWDHDEDHLEDLMVLPEGGPLLVLENRGSWSLERADRNQPTEARGDVVRATRLCLGPLRGERQWALAWDAARATRPALLVRELGSFAWRRPAGSDSLLDGLWPIDARILDIDGDARDELLLLAEGAGGETRSNATLAQIRLPETESERCELVDRAPLPGDSTGLLIGDLDGDGHPDLVVPTSSGAATFRRTSFGSDLTRCFPVALAGQDDRRHATGAYVELWEAEERRLRLRWPPQAGRDQLCLWPTVRGQGGGTVTILRVLWPDGNTDDFEPRPGVLLIARRR